MKATVNESSTSFLTVAFTDKAGAPALPVSLTYRVDCISTGAAVVPETAIFPDTNVEITIAAAENAILDTTNAKELKRVTVVAGFTGGEQHCEEYDYYVRNLSQIV
jgi:hypothetical protein